ncbi:mRNA-decapping enzyme 1A [Aplysia californica]|uniref:mRNA-decapping enzyme 1A n=1 Tax=Aplysia californica TaxID=6500 RepID=A0ABM1W4K5_APLCA|nr:mRNA-decapping enzyme 1A [Aplysia californica]
MSLTALAPPSGSTSTSQAPPLATLTDSPAVGEAGRKTSAASMPMLLKPSDLDPSLAKPKSVRSADRRAAHWPPAGVSQPLTSLLTPQAFSDRVPASESILPRATSSSPLVTSALPHALMSVTATSALTTPPAPLTREQLQQTMLHLIKNDSSFLSTVHSAYLESFHAATGNNKS